MVFEKRQIQVVDKNTEKELKDTSQEIMLELKFKTSEFFRKLKEQSQNTKVER